MPFIPPLYPSKFEYEHVASQIISTYSFVIDEKESHVWILQIMMCCVEIHSCTMNIGYLYITVASRKLSMIKFLISIARRLQS